MVQMSWAIPNANRVFDHKQHCTMHSYALGMDEHNTEILVYEIQILWTSSYTPSHPTWNHTLIPSSPIDWIHVGIFSMSKHLLCAPHVVRAVIPDNLYFNVQCCDDHEMDTNRWATGRAPFKPPNRNIHLQWPHRRRQHHCRAPLPKRPQATEPTKPNTHTGISIHMRWVCGGECSPILSVGRCVPVWVCLMASDSGRSFASHSTCVVPHTFNRMFLQQLTTSSNKRNHILFSFCALLCVYSRGLRLDLWLYAHETYTMPVCRVSSSLVWQRCGDVRVVRARITIGYN